MIPTVQPITVQPRPLNERLWTLHRRSVDRTITSLEAVELEALCRTLEAEQDNHVGGGR
jgi:hypothetical protein